MMTMGVRSLRNNGRWLDHVPRLARQRLAYEILGLCRNVLEELVGEVQLAVTDVVERLLVRVTTEGREARQ